jgi:hypothetical protein
MTTPVLPLFEYEIAQLATTVLAKCAMTDQDRPYSLHATRTVYGLLWGHLRGRVPLPLTVDLRAVVVAAATRYNRGSRRPGVPGSPGTSKLRRSRRSSASLPRRLRSLIAIVSGRFDGFETSSAKVPKS